MSELKALLLSDEQQKMIDCAKNGKNVLVDACIGSGKTTAIQYLCNALPENKRILYLTYNKLLKIDARKKITNRNVTVTNYHGFAYVALNHIGVRTAVSDLIQTFNRKKPPTDSYDLLIIDEYQDIEQEFSEMLLCIKDRNPDIQLIAVGDMEQKIYDKTTLNANDFIRSFLGEYESLTFSKCFRLSWELAAKLGRIWGKPIEGVNTNCIVEHKSAREVIRYLSKQCPADVLCLGARTGKLSWVLNRLEKDYPNIYNKETVYASISDDDSGATQPRADSAIFTTYDSSKGLERPICVVFDFTESYWSSRINKPQQSYEILRNIFCVAASRGKEQIIFVRNDDSELSEETLKTKGVLCEKYESLNISNMFDFKYKESIEECYRLLDVKQLSSENDEIRIKNHDGLIDLSPCIGIFQEAVYFDNFDIDKEIRLWEMLNQGKRVHINEEIYEASLEKKVLYLVSLNTSHERYQDQVELPFITMDEEERIKKRLAERLKPNENVQVECTIPFADGEGKWLFEAKGFADVVKNDTVYELKFVSELKHEHFLQCACYIVALNLKQGVLWNTRDNTAYEITVPNRGVFLDAVANTITKGRIKHYYEPKRVLISDKRYPRSEACANVPKEQAQKAFGQTAMDAMPPKMVVKKRSDTTISMGTTFRNLISRLLFQARSDTPKVKRQKISERMTPENVVPLLAGKDHCYIAVIDTETTFSNEVMSIGVVIADGDTYRMLDKRYYLIKPMYRRGGMYSYALHQRGIEESVASRTETIKNIVQLLAQYGISSVFAYNASFDRNHLPELSHMNWYDIMRLAAYRQHNDKIPKDARCCRTGRLKSGFGVEAMLRLLSGDRMYYERHHALTDAIDELKIMQLLNHPIQDYQIALIRG